MWPGEDAINKTNNYSKAFNCLSMPYVQHMKPIETIEAGLIPSKFKFLSPQILRKRKKKASSNKDNKLPRKHALFMES